MEPATAIGLLMKLMIISCSIAQIGLKHNDARELKCVSDGIDCLGDHLVDGSYNKTTYDECKAKALSAPKKAK